LEETTITIKALAITKALTIKDRASINGKDKDSTTAIRDKDSTTIKDKALTTTIKALHSDQKLEKHAFIRLFNQSLDNLKERESAKSKLNLAKVSRALLKLW